MTNSRPSFQVTQENITPQSSPNPRANNRIPSIEVIFNFLPSFLELSHSGQQDDEQQQQGQDCRVQDHGPELEGEADEWARGKQVGGVQGGQAGVRVPQHCQEHQAGYHQHLHQAGEADTPGQEETFFDDKPVEIQELTYIFKHDIDNLNRQIGQLQNIVRPAPAPAVPQYQCGGSASVQACHHVQ